MAIGRALAMPAVFFVPLVIGRGGHFRAIVAGTLGMVLSLLLLAFVPHWGAASLGYVGLTALGFWSCFRAPRERVHRAVAEGQPAG